MSNEKLNNFGLGAVMKKWDEQTSDEKLETLRNQIRMNRYLIDRVYRLEKKIEKLDEHSHVDGKVVIPAHLNRQEYDDRTSTYDTLA